MQENYNIMEAKIEFMSEMSVTFCGQHILVSTGKFDSVLRNWISIIMLTNTPCKVLWVFAKVANTHFKII